MCINVYTCIYMYKSACGRVPGLPKLMSGILLSCCSILFTVSGSLSQTHLPLTILDSQLTLGFLSVLDSQLTLASLSVLGSQLTLGSLTLPSMSGMTGEPLCRLGNYVAYCGSELWTSHL